MSGKCFIKGYAITIKGIGMKKTCDLDLFLARS